MGTGYIPFTIAKDYQVLMDSAFEELGRKLKDGEKLPAAKARIAELEIKLELVRQARDSNYKRAETEISRAGKLANELVNLNARNAELKETLAKTERALAAEAGKRAVAETELARITKLWPQAGDDRVQLFSHRKQEFTSYVRVGIYESLKASLTWTEREYERVAQEHRQVCDALNRASDVETRLKGEIAELHGQKRELAASLDREIRKPQCPYKELFVMPRIDSTLFGAKQVILIGSDGIAHALHDPAAVKVMF